MPTDHPMVTVIIPVFNGEKYIAEAIQSVLDQTMADFELIIINDGSTDNTASIIASFGDNRIIYIEQENSGVSAARNMGLEQAKGEFVSFLDADDAFPEESLDVRVKYLMENKDIQIVGGGIRIMNTALEILEDAKTPNYRGLFLPKLLRLDGQVFAGICYLFRRAIIISERFDEGMTHCEDYLFLISIAAKHEVQYGSVCDFIYNYRVHCESASIKEAAWRTGFISLIKKTSRIDGISYGMTIIMRLKVIIMLMKWHIKRRTVKNIHQLFDVVFFK